MKERRLVPRYKVALCIVVEGSAAETLDISSMGVYFTTEQPLVPGQEISLVLPFSHATASGTRVKCRGRVVRVEGGNGKPRLVGATYEPIEFDVGANGSKGQDTG